MSLRIGDRGLEEGSLEKRGSPRTHTQRKKKKLKLGGEEGYKKKKKKTKKAHQKALG